MSFFFDFFDFFRPKLALHSDNIGMGHDGMSYSLPSRDLIAGK